MEILSGSDERQERPAWKGDFMNFEIIKELEKEQLKAEVPQFATGDTVRVHNRIKEGTRERVLG